MTVFISFVQIKDDIEKFKRQGVEMEEKRKAILRSLEADLASVSEQTTAFEARFTAATKVLDQLKSGKNNSTYIIYTCSKDQEILIFTSFHMQYKCIG